MVFLDPLSVLFPSPTSYDKLVAETVAHEVGHGLGLRHVNPFTKEKPFIDENGEATSSIEVMDYEVDRGLFGVRIGGKTERFTNKISEIIEPPYNPEEFPRPNGKTSEQARTGIFHNPMYHLRRWVLKEEPIDSDERLADGTEPGAWDKKSGGEVSSPVEIAFNTIEAPVALFNLMTMVDSQGGVLSSNNPEPETLLFQLFDFIDPNNLSDLKLLMDEDLPLRLFASSVPGGDLDIFFGFGDASNPNPVFDDLSTGGLFGNIFQFSPDTESFEKVGEFSALVKPASTTITEIEIDIKPGSGNNPINLKSKGVLPVAILTTGDFDATTVDHTTVTFEGASETHVNKKSGQPKRHEEDVDGDGDTDLVLHFRLDDTTLTGDSAGGTLTGETFDGQSIIGIDRINIVPPKAAPAVLIVPVESLLQQNYPNPFNPETWIPYRISKDVDVVIKIYNASGHLIRTLDLGQKTAGFYTSRSKAAYWDGRNESGEQVASSIYFYKIQSGEFTATRKMLLLK